MCWKSDFLSPASYMCYEDTPSVHREEGVGSWNANVIEIRGLLKELTCTHSDHSVRWRVVW